MIVRFRVASSRRSFSWEAVRKTGREKSAATGSFMRRTFSNFSGAVSCAAPRQTERLEQASFRVNETHFHIMKYLEWPYLRSV